MAGTLYVKPASETESCPQCGQDVPPQWLRLEEPDGEPLGEFDTRREAKEAALEERTDEAVVLLRADGSVHSEMRAEGELDERPHANRRPDRSPDQSEDQIVVNGGAASEAVN
jgi:hypothetical protein